MKYILSVIILIMISVSGFSQEYMPFPKDSVEWFVESSYFGSYTSNDEKERYFVKGDTMVNATSFTELFVEYISSGTIYTVGLLYQDSTNAKLYLNEGQQNFNTDIEKSLLIYDLDLKVGQTTSFHLFDDSVVEDIDSISINGLFRKRIKIDTGDDDVYFIEGVGTSAGLYPSYYLGTVNSTLMCLKILEGESKISIDIYEGGCDRFSSIHSNKFNEEALVYPNPFSENIIIESKLLEQDLVSLKLYNMLGQIEYSKIVRFSNEMKLNTSTLNSGVYFLILENENDTVLTRKIVKE